MKPAFWLSSEDRGELLDADGVVAIGTGGDHADPGARFLLHEAEILLRFLGGLAVFGGAEGVLLPAGQGVHDGLDLAVAGVLRGNLLHRLAVERGEAQGICGMSYQTLLASDPAWIKGGKVRILLQIGLHPHPALKGVPMALDLVKKPEDKSMLEFLMLQQEVGRPIAAPPGIPADRLAALRKAFDETMKDPQFLAEAKKLRLQIEPVGGVEMLQLIKRTYDMPKSVIAPAQALLGPGAKKGHKKKTKS